MGNRQEMDKTTKIIRVIFWGAIMLDLIFVGLFETDTLPSGYWAAGYDQKEFIVTAAMVLLVLAMVPLSLKLFKLRRVEAELQENKENALLKWGVTRLIMLIVPLLANTLLYYAYMNTDFGYMAIIVAIVLPFIYHHEI